MRQRVGGLLLVVLILSDGRRKTSKAVSGNKIPATLGELSDNMNEAETFDAVQGRSNGTRENGYSLKKNVGNGLQGINTNPMEILVLFLEGLADIDFAQDDNIKEKMQTIASNAVVELIGALATTLHPLLGVVFSLFSALFGWGPEEVSKPEGLTYEQVDNLIQGNLRDLRIEMIEMGVEEAREIMDTASANAYFDELPSQLTRYFPKVFKRCWDFPESDDCARWRIGQGCDYCLAGASLQLELHFTALMNMCASAVASYGGTRLQSFPGFVDQIHKAAERTRQHFYEFSLARLTFNSPETGLSKGGIYCKNNNGDSYRPVYCQRLASTDHHLGKTFCEPTEEEVDGISKMGNKVRIDDYCLTWQSLVNLKERRECERLARLHLKNEVHKCFVEYQANITADLLQSENLAKANWNCAKDMHNKHGNSWNAV